MSKEQQIEEMVNEMTVRCNTTIRCHNCRNCKYRGKTRGNLTCTDYLYAETLYEAGYRKIIQDGTTTVDLVRALGEARTKIARLKDKIKKAKTKAVREFAEELILSCVCMSTYDETRILTTSDKRIEQLVKEYKK